MHQPLTDRPRIHVLALGGTIAMAGASASGVVPTLSADDLLAALPGLDHLDLRAESFRQRPGASLAIPDLLALQERIAELSAEGADGVVITQGTDSLEEVAYYLDLGWRGTQPIVVTGAMRPPGAPGADGAANLYAAIVTASSAAARNCGVLVVMDDQVHSAARVRKVRTAGPGAFQSADTGPLGRVTEGSLRLLAQRNDRVAAPALDRDRLLATEVALLPVPLGAQPGLLSVLPEAGYAGLVVEAMGVGHVPEWWVGPLAELSERIPVVLASRTGAGPVHASTYGFAGSETDLLARGLIAAGYLDGRRARLLLTALLAGGVPRRELGAWFART